MEQCYKDALRKNRSLQTNRKTMPSSYEQALFSANWNYVSDEIRVALPEVATSKSKVINTSLEGLLPTKATAISTVVTESTPEKSITEKTMILDSLHQFGKEALDENDQRPVQMQGIEITVKKGEVNTQVSHTFENVELVGKSELETEIETITNKALTNLRFKVGDLNRFSLKSLNVIFVGDILQTHEIPAAETNNEFLSLFNSATADLFGKMVKAMRLTPEQYLLSATSFGDDKSRESYMDVLLKEIQFFKPELIITLGAAPTHAMLNMKKRLKEVHGNF